MHRILQGLRRVEMQYFPVWVLRTKKGEVHTRPAAGTAASEMWKLNVQAEHTADMPDHKLPLPEIPCRAVLAWAARQGMKASAITATGLTYVPVFALHYRAGGEPFTMVVEASTGDILADYVPPTLGVSWRAIGYSICGSLVVAEAVAWGLTSYVYYLYPIRGLAFCTNYCAIKALVWLVVTSGLIVLFSAPSPSQSRRRSRDKK